MFPSYHNWFKRQLHKTLPIKLYFGHVSYINVIYLTIRPQNGELWMNLYWSKEIKQMVTQVTGRNEMI